jgi:hypothetical protein
VSDSSRSFENTSVVAILAKRAREDRDSLLDELVEMLSSVVPGVTVERALIRRHVTAVRIPLGDYVYALRRSSNGSFEAIRQQEVRRVVVRTVPLEIDAFLEELGLALEVELRRTERGREALREWLTSHS